MSLDKKQSLDQFALEIKQLLIKIANLPMKEPDEISETMPIMETGLGIDSVDLLELIVELDKRYGLKIKNNSVGRRTLYDVQSIAEAIWQLKCA